jgi:hypothetical protein
MPFPVTWPAAQITYDISSRHLLIFINKCRCFYEDFYVRRYTDTGAARLGTLITPHVWNLLFVTTACEAMYHKTRSAGQMLRCIGIKVPASQVKREAG